MEDWPEALHYSSITGIAPESSSLRVNYFIRVVRESRMCTARSGNDVRIGAKTYRIGHVIGADAFHLDALTMGNLQIIDDQIRQELPTFSHFLWYPWRKCKVGKNAILGLSRAEMVRDTCFQSNIVSVTCG